MDRIYFRKECQEAVKVSHDILCKILQDNKDTEYGRKYNFDQITELKDFKNLPVMEYEDYKKYNGSCSRVPVIRNRHRGSGKNKSFHRNRPHRAQFR